MRTWVAMLLLGVSAHAEQPILRLFTTDDGLVRNYVLSIRRDLKGRLWFCTVEGLSLFDGERFANYRTEDGLPHRSVYDVADAEDGAYWLATKAGLYRFRLRAGSPPVFQEVSTEGGSGPLGASVLIRMRDGSVWWGTNRGLYRVMPGERPRAMIVPLGAVDNTEEAFPLISSLAEGKDGSLWIAANSLQIIRRTRDGVISIWHCDTGARSVMVDREGIVWAAGWYGVQGLDLRRNPPWVSRHKFPPDHRLFDEAAVFQDSHGDMWIGANGLARFRPDAPAGDHFAFFDSDVLPAHQRIGPIAEDSAGNLWFSAQSAGVVRMMVLTASKFTERDGLASGAVLAVFEDRNGKLQAVTGKDHALNEFEGQRFRPIRPRLPASVNVRSWGEDRIVLQSRSGEWWMDSAQGLLRYPRVSHAADLALTMPARVYTSTSDGLPGDNILRLMEDRRGDIWIGTDRGLARWSNTTNAIQDLTAELRVALPSSGFTTAFAEDSTGQVWVGLFPQGLVRYRRGRLEAVTDGLPSGMIGSLLPDREGHLWIGSSLEGLAVISDPGSPHPNIRRYGKDQGLRSNVVMALAEDRYGRIYIAGGQGVDVLDPSNNEVRRFEAGNLLRGEIGTLYCDREGAMWFGSDFGLARYIPGPDTVSSIPPPAIRQVRNSGRPVLISDEGEDHVAGLKFGAGNDVLEIEYGAVDFSIGNRLRYRYRLLPLEREWRQPVATRVVQYAGLGPGSFHFEVQAVDAKGLPAEGLASVSFRIDAPFWKTGWFLALVGISAAALVFAAHVYRVRHLLAVERVRSKLAADLHDDLGAGLAEIAILTEVARQKPREPGLEIIARRARELRGAMNDIVWSVDPHGDNLDDLVRRCRQTAFALLGNDTLEFLAPDPEYASGVKLDPECRRNVYLLFKEAITNAARHSGASNVTVSVRVTNDHLWLDIEDDGCGFDPQQPASGRGLNTITQRADGLHGTLKIESAFGRGTKVHLYAPLT